MNDFLQSSIIKILIFFTGITGWIIGIYSAIIQIRSYNKQRNSEKGYEEILTKAKNEWEGKYTEEQVQLLKSELIKLQNQVNTIRRDVPLKAKEVFLTEQLYAINQNMIDSYKHREDFLNEIEQLKKQSKGISVTIDLKEEIETLVKPLYLRKRKQEQRFKILLYTILGIVSVLVFPFLIQFMNLRIKHHGYNGNYGIPIYVIMLIALVFALGLIAIINSNVINENRIFKFKFWTFLLLILLFFFSIFFGFVIWLIFFETIDFQYVENEFAKIIIGLIIVFIFSITVGLFVKIFIKFNKLL
ncbi:MAG: hypothetical protein WCO44_09600 [Bacteroidota bacterium]